MKNITLNIPDMQSVHCQTRVTNAIKNVDGINIEKVAAGSLSFTVTNEQSQVIAVQAIEQAGYTVNPTEDKETIKDTPACCTTT